MEASKHIYTRPPTLLAWYRHLDYKYCWGLTSFMSPPLFLISEIIEKQLCNNNNT
jgi:hypothetical protein